MPQCIPAPPPTCLEPPAVIAHVRQERSHQAQRAGGLVVHLQYMMRYMPQYSLYSCGLCGGTPERQQYRATCASGTIYTQPHQHSAGTLAPLLTSVLLVPASGPPSTQANTPDLDGTACSQAGAAGGGGSVTWMLSLSPTHDYAAALSMGLVPWGFLSGKCVWAPGETTSQRKIQQGRERQPPPSLACLEVGDCLATALRHSGLGILRAAQQRQP